jgi:hypothetical protein
MGTSKTQRKNRKRARAWARDHPVDQLEVENPQEVEQHEQQEVEQHEQQEVQQHEQQEVQQHEQQEVQHLYEPDAELSVPELTVGEPEGYPVDHPEVEDELEADQHQAEDQLEVEQHQAEQHQAEQHQAEQHQAEQHQAEDQLEAEPDDEHEPLGFYRAHMSCIIKAGSKRTAFEIGECDWECAAIIAQAVSDLSGHNYAFTGSDDDHGWRFWRV